MNIVVVEDKITVNELREIAKEFYVSMIKGVVDIEKSVVAFGGEYHIDANIVLMDNGSKQKDIWGFNIYFDRPREEWLKYNSLINIRPLAGNNEMDVQNEDIRNKMKEVINSKII